MPIRLRAQLPHRVAPLVLALASLLASAALGAIFLGTARDAWLTAAAPGPAGPADGILLMAGLAGAVLSLWLGLGMALSALAALPGAIGYACRRMAGRVAPAAVRKAVAFVLGTTLTAALVPGTALGETTGIAHRALRPAVVASARHASGGMALAAPDASFRLVSRRPPVPDVPGVRDDGAPHDAPDAAPLPDWSPGRTQDREERVVVLRGDTLWSIAANSLGSAASAAQIDTAWHRWFAANRDVIGDDPNLILPGQLLRQPSSPRARS